MTSETKEQVKHTPLPYDIQECDDGDVYQIFTLAPYIDGTLDQIFSAEVCQIETGHRAKNKAIAEFIKLACNSHYQLVEALESVVGKAYSTPEDEATAFQKALDVLAKARGGAANA